MTLLTAKARQDHLEKLASTRDPIKALAEFVWNALDADAGKVEVALERSALGGVEAISIKDDGSGITLKRANVDFENIGDSWKKKKRSTNNKRAMHGKEGQGRLRFFSVSEAAKWTSTYQERGKKLTLSIDISASSLNRASVSEPEASSKSSTGTVVRFDRLKETFDWLASKEARAEFSAIFAPYILQYPNVKIVFDGHPIDPDETIELVEDLSVGAIKCPDRVIDDISLKVIEWKTLEESRKIHFGGATGVVLGSQPANVTAPDFRFSAYAYSKFFEELSDANLLDFEGLNDPNFTVVCDHLRDTLGDYFRKRQAERSSHLIDQFIEDGIYPYEGDPKDLIEKKEREVFDIATHAVSSYSRTFKKADNPTKKMTLSLLREAVRHNPESVSNILHAVFNLPKNRQDEFSDLLNKTELGHIIAASSVISERIVTLEVLKSIVFDPKHRMTVKERGELDVLIRDNSWIFGEKFHITLAEKGLTKIMQRVSDEIGSKRRIRKIKKPDGKSGRVDSFLGRIVPHPDGEFREFILVELKKPSLIIGRKEFDQLEDYVNAIIAQPDFKNTDTKWTFFLVTGEYDVTMKPRITQKDRPVGLFLEGEHHAVWVKTWGELIRENEGRVQFVQDRLKIEVSEEEIETRIAQLKSSIVREVS